MSRAIQSQNPYNFFPYKLFRNEQVTRPNLTLRHRRLSTACVPFAGTEETELHVSSREEDQQEEDAEPTAEDIEYVSEIERVLDLLKKNRDMLFGEVKLTILIEDPREVERRRLLGLEGPDAPTRDDLVTALEEIQEGKIPKNKAALKMLAAEMVSWPNLEVESTKKKPSKSLYAKSTDTGIDLQEAAKRLNVDWDSAAEIEDADVVDDTEVPAAVEETRHSGP
ncbi:hypothetical protein L6164_017040 [Bauhinia variegata]|uniref:Uncharacterized protein n=1 Tax=Bauhinia variegata TaxID=167791 RepID=A0ACB9N7T9_BAUVA|nr:hypothetical protein L6164_017040 [Bauhinia variegata]